MTAEHNLAREHAEVRRLMKAVEAHLVPDSPSIAGSAADLHRDVVSLLAQLTEHYAHEESGELVNDAAKVNEGTHRKVRALFDQHAGFLERLRSVERNIQAAADAERSASSQDRLELHSLFSDMFKHEYAENQLLLEVVYQDLGEGD